MSSLLQFHQWHMSSPVTMAAYRDVIRAWFALCILRIVVKLAVIKDIPAISLLGFVLQFSFFRERNLPLGSEMPNERCHPGRILEASLACFIAQPECDYLPAEHTQAANALAV
jgi:hypothetical protein